MKIALKSIFKAKGSSSALPIAIVSQKPTMAELQETRTLEDLTVGQLRILLSDGIVHLGTNSWKEIVQLVDFEADLSQEVIDHIVESKRCP